MPDQRALSEQVADVRELAREHGLYDALDLIDRALGDGDRTHWIKLFNRLEGAVAHHRNAKEGTGFTDDADDALHAAHDRVLKAAAK